MAKSMPVYQGMDLHGGLETMQDMNEYCYYVAGCVGDKNICSLAGSNDLYKRATEMFFLLYSKRDFIFNCIHYAAQ
jgi:hypothetical protein